MYMAIHIYAHTKNTKQYHNLVEGLEDLEIRGGVKTIQTTALLRSARIQRRVLETKGDFLSLRFQSKTISKRCNEKLSNE